MDQGRGGEEEEEGEVVVWGVGIEGVVGGRVSVEVGGGGGAVVVVVSEAGGIVVDVEEWRVSGRESVMVQEGNLWIFGKGRRSCGRGRGLDEWWWQRVEMEIEMGTRTHGASKDDDDNLLVWMKQRMAAGVDGSNMMVHAFPG